MALGERRAKAVESFLITTGVSPNQLEAVSYGKEMPINAATMRPVCVGGLYLIDKA